MTSQWVQIDVSSRMGPKARRNVEAIREAMEDMDELKKVADQAAFGADWAALEAAFGIPSGKGETYYNLLAGAVAALNASSAVTGYAHRLG